MADDFKLSLHNLRNKAEAMLAHVDTLCKTAEIFPTPDQWPNVLDKFLAVSHVQSEGLIHELRNAGLDSLLLKPLSLPDGLVPEYIPELWRTKLDPEEERKERLLVEQYKNEFELTSSTFPDPTDLCEFANNKISKYNEMVDRLAGDISQLAQQFKKELSSGMMDIDREYSLKVEMLDFSQRLYEWDEAVRRGEKLNQSEALKRDRQIEEENRIQSQRTHQQQLQRQAQAKLTPEEEQQRLFREAQERRERAERENELQMLAARKEAQAANLRQSASIQGTGGGYGTTNEPPSKRPKR